MAYSGTVTLGSIMTTVTVVVGLAVGWATTKAQVASNATEILQLKADQRRSDERIRQVELTSSSMGADIRGIQAGVNEIRIDVKQLLRTNK